MHVAKRKFILEKATSDNATSSDNTTKPLAFRKIAQLILQITLCCKIHMKKWWMNECSNDTLQKERMNSYG